MSRKYPPIADLVPHDVPMRVLEELTAWSPGAATCRFVLRTHAPFVSNRRAHCVCALEWMGQAVAACLGYEAFQAGDGVRVGMIIGCPRFDLLREHIDVGSTVVVEVKRIRGSEVVSRFAGEVWLPSDAVDTAASNDAATSPREPVARAELTVYHAEAPPT